MTSPTALIRLPQAQAQALLSKIYALSKTRVPLRGLVKLILWILLIANAKSLPFVWHFRVFRPVLWLHIRWRSLQLKNILLFKSKEENRRILSEWNESMLPLGRNPFEATETYRSWASMDDSDYNGHLSNSSYAKTQDAARLKVALQFFLQFFRGGGWMALAGTHYHFIREIPMFSRYEVRANVVAWDQKWIYIVGRFVTKPSAKALAKSRKAKSKFGATNGDGKPKPTPPSQSEAEAGEENSFSVTLRQPHTSTEISTPLPSSPPASNPSSSPFSTDIADQLLANIKAESGQQEREKDGAILHTIAISQACYKVGRITVPPAIVLALNGFCCASSLPSPSASASSSRRVIPTHWHHVRRTLDDPKALNKFMKGGWRDVPEGERWWEVALGGEVEEMRVRNLKVLEGLRVGLDGARVL